MQMYSPVWIYCWWLGAFNHLRAHVCNSTALIVDFNVGAFKVWRHFLLRDHVWPHHLIPWNNFPACWISSLPQRHYSKWRQNLLLKAHLSSALIQTPKRASHSFLTRASGPARPGATTYCEISCVGRVQLLRDQINHVQNTGLTVKRH